MDKEQQKTELISMLEKRKETHKTNYVAVYQLKVNVYSKCIYQMCSIAPKLVQFSSIIISQIVAIQYTDDYQPK